MSADRKNWHASHKQSLTRGERAADVLRNSMGSWRFVAGFIAVMIIWAIVNFWIRDPWDKYPFILLNLFLSMLAGLQGAILLIAARRADAVSAAMAEHDYRTNVEAKKEVEELMAMHHKQLQRLEEVITLLKEKS